MELGRVLLINFHYVLDMIIIGIYKSLLWKNMRRQPASERAPGDKPEQWAPFCFRGVMGIPDLRLQLFLEVSDTDESKRASKPQEPRMKNFEFCFHSERTGRPSAAERLNETGPIISRSDGESYHLVLGDRTISFPAEESSRKSGRMIAGFWYVKDENDEAAQVTGIVAVILRNPPKRGVALRCHVETVADRLAEKFGKSDALATLYEFDGNRLRKVS